MWGLWQWDLASYIEQEVQLEMSMMRWMRGFLLKDGKNIAELRELLGLEQFSLMIKKNSLRW